jgi:hydrogenase maturation protease
LADSLKILVYGFGNPGRKDDGLGPAFADKVGEWAKNSGIRWIDTDSNYQLNIEDAYTIQDYDIVIYADASKEDIDHFLIDRVSPSGKTAFNTHSVSPGFVLDLCRRLYAKDPLIFLLHLKGYEYDLEEGLTPRAEENINIAFEFLEKALIKPEIFLDWKSVIPVI